MIRAQLFRAGQPPAEADLQAWPSLRADDSNTLWVDVDAPTAEETARVAELFGIHDEALAAARRGDRHPTVRFYEDRYLVTATAVDVDEGHDEPEVAVTELDAWVGPNFIVTLHDRPLPFAERLRERTGTNPWPRRLASSYLLYVVLDTLVGHYARELDEIEDGVQRLEERMLGDPGRATLNRMLVLKRHIEGVRRLVAPHREALGALVGADSPIEEPGLEQYFRDLLARLNTVVDGLDQLRDIAAGAFALHLSNVGQRTNQQLRVLTFLSAVLLPIAAITGLFGTNFKLGAYDYGAGEPFYVMLAGTAAIVAGMLAFFRRRGWL
jgi:magnesium transporter